MCDVLNSVLYTDRAFALHLSLCAAHTGTCRVYCLVAVSRGRTERRSTAVGLGYNAREDSSFSVLVKLYVSAPTLASKSIWGTPPTNSRKCQSDASSNDEDTSNNAPISAGWELHESRGMGACGCAMAPKNKRDIGVA